MHSTLTSPGGERRLGRLGVFEHSQHRVGVLELPVLHEEREAAEVVRFGDDDAFSAAFGDHEVGADRVGVVVDPRDHPARDVLDVAAEHEPRLFRDRRHHAEERRQAAEQRQDVVLVRLGPEELPQLCHLLRVVGCDVLRLGEVVRQVIQLDGVGFGIPSGPEAPEHLGVERPGDALQPLAEQPAVLVHAAVAEDLVVLLNVPLGERPRPRTSPRR